MARTSRRRKLLLKTLVPGGVLVLAAIVVVVVRSLEHEAPYTPGEAVEGITRELERSVPQGFTPVAFREVSQEAGITFRHFHGYRSIQLPEDMGSGLAWGDYDGDGDPDLYLVNEAGPLNQEEAWPRSPASNQLYRNEGDGTFTDVTEAAGVALREIGMGAAWGDYDSDRDLDLVVTSYLAIHLFRNEGDGSFTEVTHEAGLDRFVEYWAGASWGDYDRDGDLDLYICGYVHYDFDPADQKRTTLQYDALIPASLNPSTYRPIANLLLRNEGDGTFSDATEGSGVENEQGRSLNAAWCDFDEDGWPDLYVANDISDNVMFRNRGDGTFEDISHSAWVADYRGAMGIAVADWDSDRDIDMFISHWLAQENALYVNILSERRKLNQPAQTGINFMDDADEMGLGQIALDYIGWAACFMDFDNDGYPDLFVSNGSTFQREEDERLLIPMKPLLFWNKGPVHGFYDVGPLCSNYFNREWVGRGGAPADYDGDGDLDLAVIRFGDPLALLRNEGEPRHHWLGIRLRGRGKNTFGVGARVTASHASFSQAAVVGANPSYLSQRDLTLHFGLGDSVEADSLEILWPSGRLQRLYDVQGDRVLTLEEPE
jgi:hypothetical protein